MTEVERYLKKLHDYTNSVNFEEKDITKNLEQAKKFSKIIREILGVSTLNTYVMTVPTTNLILTRARKNNTTGQLFTNLKDLTYPKSELINKHGRANTWLQPRYYCSDTPGTALFETRPRDEWVTIVSIKVSKPKLILLAVKPNSKYEITGENDATSKDIAFNRFMAEKFVEQIPKEKHHLYLPTAILTNLLINHFDGIAFPSVASNLNGENFALRTEIIDKYSKILRLVFKKLMITHLLLNSKQSVCIVQNLLTQMDLLFGKKLTVKATKLMRTYTIEKLNLTKNKNHSEAVRHKCLFLFNR